MKKRNFFLLSIILSVLLSCGVQRSKMNMKERPEVIRQMLEDRDFKAIFTW